MLPIIYVKYLCFKNRFNQSSKSIKDYITYLAVIIFPYLIFKLSEQIFLELIYNPRFDLLILSKITSSLFFALSLIVSIASIIATIGNLYSAKDLNLLLTLPLRKSEIFLSKFISIFIESSWTIFLFLLPIIFSFAAVLNLKFHFYLCVITSAFLLAVFSASIGVIISCIAVTRISPKVCLEIVLSIMSIGLVSMMVFGNNNNPTIGANKNSSEEMISYFSKSESNLILPHKISAELVASYWDSKLNLYGFLGLILISALALTSAIYCYCWITPKTHKVAIKKNTLINKIYKPVLRTKRNFIKGTLGAFISKENKLLLRDLSQASQLIILVFVTFVYLLNFQHLKNKPNIELDSMQFWYVLLAVSNISMGSCVLTAIATRFVFPSISMEGRCINLLKSAPLKISDIVFYKYTTWLVPFSIISLIVLLSGALAIDANDSTILYTGFIGLNLSFTLVAVAIGTGAKYAKFDWESPTQIATGFGSLILMFKSVIVVMLYLVLSTIPISIFYFGNIYKLESITICGLTMLLTILASYLLVRDNLKLGSISLQEQS